MIPLQSEPMPMTMKKRTVAILIFDQVEVLDFTGPFEVFSVASELLYNILFEVKIVAENTSPVSTVNGMKVIPSQSIYDISECDILVIPGGVGTRKLLNNTRLIQHIQNLHQKAKYVMSVCSGALLLAEAGLLNGQAYCTHRDIYADMEKLVPDGKPMKGERFASAGKVFTSAGISAGIDLSLHILNLMHGDEVMRRTSGYMEYRLWVD